MFIGQYAHTLDEKKRISLPVKFRKEIGKSLVVTRGLDRCLFVYPKKEWQRISFELSKRGMLDQNSRGFSRFFISSAQEIEVDAVGRIVIPEHLREFANLNEKLIFAGVHNRIEVWEEKTWQDYQKKLASEADQMAEKLGEIGAI